MINLFKIVILILNLLSLYYRQYAISKIILKSTNYIKLWQS